MDVLDNNSGDKGGSSGALPKFSLPQSSDSWHGLLSHEVSVFVRSWLSITLANMGDCRQAFVFGIKQPDQQIYLIASANDSLEPAHYSAIIESTLVNPVADIHTLEGQYVSQVLSFPVVTADKLAALVIIDPGEVGEESLRNYLQQLQWGVGQLEAFFIRKEVHAQKDRVDRILKSLELALATLEQDNLLAAARALTTEIAVTLGAERVSLGVVQGKHSEVLAISHMARFAAEANLVRAIGSAMDESIDQHNLVMVPPQEGRDSAPLTWAARELYSASSAGLICTVPFQHGKEFSGALVIEFAEAGQLDTGKLSVIEAITAMMAPVLDLYQRNDRSILKRAKDGLFKQLEKLTGPGHVLFKSLCILLSFVVLAMCLIKSEYRLTADAVLEGRELRAAVSPFNGFIESAYHRAGDLVQKDALLATLDDTELNLELNKWRAKRQQTTRRLREARADQNNSEFRVFKAQLEEANTEIELLEEKISHTQIIAPFDGYIVSGDLSQSLGAPTERGEVLFEVAPLDDYRVIILIDERDVTYLEIGQHGELLLKGLPDQSLGLTVSRITPVARAEDGKNTFEIEAMLQDRQVSLLPGMEGVVKLQAGDQTLIWIWTHRVWEWLRLWIWSWWP